jgi:predicted dehydrogenase
VPEAEIVCVCDIRPEMAEEAAQTTGARMYTDFDEMLRSETIDMLDICLPTYLHANFAVKALEKGIHVLTEKPLSLKREDVRRVYDAAKANGCRAMVAQVVRFWREYVYVREAFESGIYGKLLSGAMQRLGNTPRWSWDNWMRDPERSGLVPFDLHIHDLDYIVSTFGKPQRVVCDRARRKSGLYPRGVPL